MKHVVITGGATGIGWAIAKQYWQQGHHLHLVDKNAVALERCRIELACNITTYAVDLTDAHQMSSLVRQLLALPLWRLINNAGITHLSKASETHLNVFDTVMRLNWQAPVSLTQALLPRLQGAKVINIVSMAAMLPLPGRAGYCASKAALAQHFEAWRPELHALGVTLLMVYPAFVATQIEKHALSKDGKPTGRARSTTGDTLPPDTLARTVLVADKKGKRRLIGSSLTARMGLCLWRWWPALYERICWRRFRQEWAISAPPKGHSHVD